MIAFGFSRLREKLLRLLEWYCLYTVCSSRCLANHVRAVKIHSYCVFTSVQYCLFMSVLYVTAVCNVWCVMTFPRKQLLASIGKLSWHWWMARYCSVRGKQNHGSWLMGTSLILFNSGAGRNLKVEGHNFRRIATFKQTLCFGPGWSWFIWKVVKHFNDRFVVNKKNIKSRAWMTHLVDHNG